MSSVASHHTRTSGRGSSVLNTNNASMSTSSTQQRGSASALSFPSNIASIHIPSNLTPLTDDTSTYTSVTKICLALSQYTAATNGNGFLMHERTFARDISRALAALMTCVREHTDRRCRVLAARCLALFARSTYIKIGTSSVKFAESTPCHNIAANSLEDECSNSTAVCLADCALNDEDDGVAATAFESLAALCTDVASDDLMREIRNIYGNSIMMESVDKISSIEEDGDLAGEIRRQVLSAVIPSRIRQMVHRASLMRNSTHRVRSIPFITMALTFFIDTGYVDCGATLADEVAQTIILDGILNNPDLKLRHGCAVSGIRLLSSHLEAPWGERLCYLACDVLLEEAPNYFSTQHNSHEENELIDLRAFNLATILIAARGIPIGQRAGFLVRVLEKVYSLPSAMPAPKGTILSDRSNTGYPSRFGYLCEIAILILADGFLPEPYCHQGRFEALEYLLTDENILEVIECRNMENDDAMISDEINQGRRIAEEMVVSFCSCASIVGDYIVQNQREKVITTAEEWLRCSIFILDTFAPCLGWSWQYDSEENNLSIESVLGLDAVVEAFMALLGQLCSYVGIILPYQSPTAPKKWAASPKAAPSSPLGFCDWAKTELNELCDDLFQYIMLRKEIPSTTRVMLLSILAGNWAHKCSMGVDRDGTNSDENKARGLIEQLGTELNTILKIYNSQNIDGKSLCLECLHSIEVVAHAALEPGARGNVFNMSRDSSAIDTDLIEVASSAVDLLNSLKDNDDMQSSPDVLNRCLTVVERITVAMDGDTLGSSANILRRTASFQSFPAFGKRTRSLPEAMFHRHNLPTPVALFSSSRISQNGNSNGCSDHSVTQQGFLYSLSKLSKASIFWQLCRKKCNKQLMNAISSQMCQSSSIAANPRNPLRLGSRKRGRPAAHIVEPLWSNSISRLSGASDPVQVLAGFYIRRCHRHDGEDARKLAIFVKIYNSTPTSISGGCKLDLFIKRMEPEEESDSLLPSYISTNLHIQFPQKPCKASKMSSYSSSFRDEIKSSESLTWDVNVDNWNFGPVEFHVDVTFREVQEDHNAYRLKASVLNADQLQQVSSEDERGNAIYANRSFESAKNEQLEESFEPENTIIMSSAEEFIEEIAFDEDSNDQIVSCSKSVHVSNLILLHRCPLVFFDGVGTGDATLFWMLWSKDHLKFHVTLPLTRRTRRENLSSIAMRLKLECSKMCIKQDNQLDGDTKVAWAFVSWFGNRLFCLFRKNKEGGTADLEIRCDDPLLLYSFVGTRSSRNVFSEALTIGEWECQQTSSVQDINCNEGVETSCTTSAQAK